MRGRSCGATTRRNTDAEPWPRLRATAVWPSRARRRSSRFNRLARAQTRKGASFRVSAATSVSPKGSCVVTHCGGALQPMSGASNRASMPDGMMRKARPMASERCGTARKNPERRERSCAPPAYTITSATMRAAQVLNTPVKSVRRNAPANCGCASMSANAAASDNPGTTRARAKVSGTRTRSANGRNAVRRLAVIANARGGTCLSPCRTA